MEISYIVMEPEDVHCTKQSQFDVNAYSFVGFIITCIKFGRSLFQKREETRLKMVQRPALVSQKYMSFWTILDLVNTCWIFVLPL